MSPQTGKETESTPSTHPASSFRRRAISLLVGGSLLPLALTAASPPAAASSLANNHPLCGTLGKSIQASSGYQMWCFGPQVNGGTAGPLSATSTSGSVSNGSKGNNVNAASLQEDVTPSGVRVFGQSEVSIAAVGDNVVEAWNDATGFFSPCPSPLNKEELTGFGFSSDGGATFTDEGAPPNSNCNVKKLFGDPSVAGWTSGGQTYFYISSLYLPNAFFGANNIAISTCHVAAGTALGCSQPVIAATSSQCQSFFGLVFCSFLDKEFLSLDSARGRLYISYTDFGFSDAGQIKLAVCDIGTPAGGSGPLGGTAASPVCRNGNTPAGITGTPAYLTIAGPDPNFCENEGAYPAVDPLTGDVYVAYEHNWATNLFAGLFGGPCAMVATQNVVKHVASSCLTLPTASCTAPDGSAAASVVSMDAAFIPGYNRFPMNDFPRIAVSNTSGTVSMVWNDATADALGDIVLQSYQLGSALAPVQAAPVRINRRTGGANFLPALRNVDSKGNLQVSWYVRDTGNTALTDVDLASVDPLATGPNGANQTVTNVTSDWNAVSSDVIPNFGDYTDNYALGDRDFVAWSDGRIGVPQPFSARQ